MGSSKLAALGGNPTVPTLHPYRSIGVSEIEAVNRVLESQCLSGFYGSPGPEFLGGPVVRAFEEQWADRFGVQFAVSVNSNTSGLIAAMGAIGLSPGDEVIVPSWSMSATAVAPLFYGGIPVFADIEEETFCIDPLEVEQRITEKTRAIIAVNLFGHPAQLSRLRTLADEKNLFLIEDNAQAPLGREGQNLCGTVGDIGVYSLNYHKHIHTGEGGVCVTASEELAWRLQLIRNHGENLVESEEIQDISNLVGMNLRLTEMSAAVGTAQLADIDAHVESRERIAKALSEGTLDLKGWTPPVVRQECRHNYYCWVARYSEEEVGIPLKLFSRALSAEGFPNFTGYLPPLYTLPIFQRRQAIGRHGFPFSLSERDYPSGLAPVTERLHDDGVLLFEPCAWEIDDELSNKLVEAVRKVHEQVESLAAADLV